MNDPEMPGAWVCLKCGFQLQKNVMFAGSGSIRADTSPLNEICPNDGTLMKPLTFRQVNEELFQALLIERRRLNWLDAHCSFVADYDYNLGPFKTGELRKLADAGLAVDDERLEKKGTM